MELLLVGVIDSLLLWPFLLPPSPDGTITRCGSGGGGGGGGGGGIELTATCCGCCGADFFDEDGVAVLLAPPPNPSFRTLRSLSRIEKAAVLSLLFLLSCSSTDGACSWFDGDGASLPRRDCDSDDKSADADGDDDVDDSAPLCLCRTTRFAIIDFSERLPPLLSFLLFLPPPPPALLSKER